MYEETLFKIHTSPDRLHLLYSQYGSSWQEDYDRIYKLRRCKDRCDRRRGHRGLHSELAVAVYYLLNELERKKNAKLGEIGVSKRLEHGPSIVFT